MRYYNAQIEIIFFLCTIILIMLFCQHFISSHNIGYYSASYYCREHIRIDCAHPTQEETELSLFHAQTLFRLNQTMPFTEEYDLLISQLFPKMGENSRISTLVQTLDTP